MRLTPSVLAATALAACLCASPAPAQTDNQPPKGFTALFDGKTLEGWFGWDTKDPRTLWKMSDQERAGSPGKDPLVLADKPFGQWNHFRILQVGARTTVYLNDKLVVDHAVLENFWDPKREMPLFPRGPIQLQTHGGEIRWRNLFVR